jgi:glycosyltransferase involved in cell wall biosynthesis
VGQHPAPRDPEVPITVLMPVYNVAPYLRRALDSVFRQTWQDFELLIVNDGSTDDTRAILAETRDPRLRVIDQPHAGLAAALRAGVEQARGRYLARMDGDDETLPRRLAVQKAHLDRAPHVVLVHTLAQPIDPDGRALPMVLGDPRPSMETKWLLQWQNPILHPTVMLRRETLEMHGLNFRLELFRADEFDLWNRLAPYGEFEAIPEVLHRYRLNPAGMTHRNPVDRQAAAFTQVIRENFARLGVPLAAGAAEELAVISGGTRIDPIAQRYPELRGTLHTLQAALADRFCHAFDVDPDWLQAVQAEQLVRWARYMLGTSRGYAAALLRQAVQRRRAVLRSPFLWTVAAALTLPPALCRRLARRDARHAPMSARVG